MKRLVVRALGWLGTTAVLAISGGGCGRATTENAAEPPVLVSAVRPVRHRFREVVRVQGVARAKDVVRIAARVPGPIEAMWVEDGDEVTAGRPLFQTDREHLEHQVRISEDAVRVARAGRREAEAALADARAALGKAEADHARAARMFEQDGAIPLDALELAVMARDRARAAAERASAAVELAIAREQQAESALAVAKRQLADSTISSPIAGVVTRRFLRVGEYAAAGTPVLQVESADRVEVVAWLAAPLHGRVVEGRARLRFARSDGGVAEVPVDHVAPTVDPRTRTFEVRATLTRAEGAPVPGRAVDVEVEVDEHEGWAVPSAAAVRHGDRATLLLVEGGRARAVEVRVGAEADGLIEIHDGLVESADVIVEGRGLVRDGDPIRVVQGEHAR